jgi:hypothetical protein
VIGRCGVKKTEKSSGYAPINRENLPLVLIRCQS